MPRPKITTTQWVNFHPYEKADAADRFYAKIADKVHSHIAKSKLFSIFYNDYQTSSFVAIRLTMYFEDLASNIGVWRTVTTEFKERYGYTLPFYDLSKQYDEDLVNQEDIRFLIWNEMQSYENTKELFNPLHPYIDYLATDIYNLFKNEWKEAPPNERLYNYIHDKTVLESYYRTRELIEWFHANSFVTTNTFYDLGQAAEEMEDDEINFDVRIYAFKVEDGIKHKHNMLSICVPKWLGRIRNQDHEREIWENIKWKRMSIYEYHKYKDKDDQICLKDLVYDEYFWVEKHSFNADVLKKKFKDKYIIYCSLVQFKDTWNQCGMLFINKPNKHTASLIEKGREKLRVYQMETDTENMFKRYAGDKKMVFFKTKQELINAYKIMGIKNAEKTYKAFKFGENCMVMASKTNNFVLSFNYAAAVYTDYNTLYDKKFAKEYAIDFYTKDDFIDYREVCDLHDGNYLPEAQVYTSNGVKQDKLFVRKYGSYIIDYFFRCTRKYDYDAKPELVLFDGNTDN